ncbi:MAG: hypothetical protein QXD77_00055, partial [Candidatus Aenigmatarchaeota archaeon]
AMGSFQATDLDFDTAHTTSTEVACAIARRLREDFRQYGYTTNRPESAGDYKLVDINKDRTIVGRGAFRIKWNSEAGKFWAYEDLAQSAKDDLMQAGTCRDEKAQEWRCPTPYLDEECISRALGALQVGDSFLCTKKTGADVKITAGGVPSLFGNDNCGGDSKVADGTDNCGDYCAGGDKIKAWRAPGGIRVTEYIDDAYWDKGDEYPPRQCQGAQCEPLYAWFLIYNKKNKDYEIEIMQMAETIDWGAISSDLLVARLLQSEHVFRDIETAYAYPELRTRYDVTFQPTDEVTLNGVLSKLTEKLGKAWNVQIDECVGDGCYESAPATVKWKEVSDYDQSKKASKIVPVVNRIFVKAGTMTGGTLDPDVHLDTTHKYRLVMRWWRVTYGDEKWKKPACTNTMCPCVACLEEDGNAIVPRCDWDCPLGHEYQQLKSITRYQDYTIAIVDLGPTEGATR